MGMNTSANKARKEAGMRVRNRSDNTDPAVLCYPGHARLERVRFVRFGPLYQNGCQRVYAETRVCLVWRPKMESENGTGD